MKIHRTNLYQFSIRFHQPVQVHDVQLVERSGYFIIVENAQGVQGIGEISPLPGLSKETLADTGKQLGRIRETIGNEEIPSHIEQLNGKFQSWLHLNSFYPSVQFGVEMAVLNLIANSHKLPLYRLLSDLYQENVGINALLQPQTASFKDEINSFLDRGFKAIKVKVNGDINEDIAKVKEIIETIGPRALLRIDANRRWDIKQALKFGDEIGCANIEYVEEPFKEISLIPEFYEKTLIPVALDESLSAMKIDDIKSISGIEYIILKPTIVGGIEKTWNIAQNAKRHALSVIISSAYESPVGLNTLVHLAACLSKNTYSGLDTEKYFKDDLLTEKTKINNGHILADHPQVNLNDINQKLLKVIAL